MCVSKYFHSNNNNNSVRGIIVNFLNICIKIWINIFYLWFGIVAGAELYKISGIIQAELLSLGRLHFNSGSLHIDIKTLYYMPTKHSNISESLKI